MRKLPNRKPKQKFYERDNTWKRQPYHSSQRRTKRYSNGKRKAPPVTNPTNSEKEVILEKAIVQHVRPNVPIHARKRVMKRLRAGLSRDERHGLAALNPHSANVFAPCLTKAMKATPTEMTQHAVTIISDTFNLPVRGEWPQLNEFKQFVARHLTGFDYLMVVQVGLRTISDVQEVRGHTHYSSRDLVCFHAHDVVWADAASLDFRLGELPPALGAPGGDRQHITDVTGWWRYALVDPRVIETRRKRLSTRGYIPGIARITYPLQIRLLDYFRGVTKPDLCVASGCGRKVLRRAIRRAQRRGYVSGC